MSKTKRIILLVIFISSAVLFCSCTSDADVDDSNDQIPLSVSPGTASKISPEGQSYVDPEILNYGYSKITFQDGNGDIWVADLDPVTGTFLSETGKDTLIDSDAANLLITNNGPEFGLNINNWSVVYARKTDDDIQLWQAIADDAGVIMYTQLTYGSTHMTPVTQQSLTLDVNRVIYINGTWSEGSVAWLQDNPFLSEENWMSIESKKNTHPTWVEDTEYIIYRESSPDAYGQLALYNSDTGEKNVITDDAGDKSFPFAWRAPEYGNHMIAMALLDDTDDGEINKTSIVIYKDNGGDFWERISKLDIPAESEGITLGSPEPFISGGKSYLSLSIQLNSSSQPGTADAQIWIFGIDDSLENRIAFRCDDGMPGPVKRTDPEIFRGSEQFFVVYNIFTEDGFEIYNCATGLLVY